MPKGVAAMGAELPPVTQIHMPLVRRIPIVTWADPAPIKQGQPLTGRELDAITSVSGTLIYTPGPGYVPPRGSCTLSVQFIPNDSKRYDTASATAVVQVE
ncbi:MAG: hypothetical protein ABSG51_03715 [Terracidiphilus sp.]